MKNWDWTSLRDHKLAINTEIQNDIDKLELAAKLIREVNETFVEAFQNKISDPDNVPTTNSSAGTPAMKLSKCISEIKLVVGALNKFKERI